MSQEQIGVLLNHCQSQRDKVIINSLWHFGMRLSEVVNIKAGDFDWREGTVIVLGKGNRYRKCLAGNGIVEVWFREHSSLNITKGGVQTMLKRLKVGSGIPCNAHCFRRGFCIHQFKSRLSTRVVQALGGWENITMVERYSKSLSFDDALDLYNQVNTNRHS
jgi:site-specific recombinase XerD